MPDLLGAAPTAFAKDLCIWDGGTLAFRFTRVKPLKKPGKGTPLQGIMAVGGPTLGVIDGFATVDPFGVKRAGITVQFADPYAQISASWITDDFLGGNISFDNDNDGISDSTALFVAIDCESLGF